MVESLYSMRSHTQAEGFSRPPRRFSHNYNGRLVEVSSSTLNDDEMIVSLVEETGVPGGIHQPGEARGSAGLT